MKEETRVKVACWWANKLKREDKQQLFYKTLYSALEDNMSIRVDYHPDLFLKRILRTIGIPCKSPVTTVNLFPSKLAMIIEDGKVKTYRYPYDGNWVSWEETEDDQNY